MFGAFSTKPVDMASFTLPITTKEFLKIFWDDEVFFKNFLLEKIKEVRVDIPKWEKIGNLHYKRTIDSLHPLPISLPWLPLTVDSANCQEISIVHKDHKEIIYIKENSRIKGIPYVDPHVISEWYVSETDDHQCYCKVTLRFYYESATLLQSAVESNSTVELVKLFQHFQEGAPEQIEKLRNSTDTNKDKLLQLTELFPEAIKPVIAQKVVINDEINADEIQVELSSIEPPLSTKQKNRSMKRSISEAVIEDIDAVRDIHELWAMDRRDVQRSLNIIKEQANSMQSYVTLKDRWMCFQSRKRFLSLLFLFTNLKSTDYCSFVMDYRKMESWVLTIVILLISSMIIYLITQLPYIMIKTRRERSLMVETPVEVPRDIKKLRNKGNDVSSSDRQKDMTNINTNTNTNTIRNETNNNDNNNIDNDNDNDIIDDNDDNDGTNDSMTDTDTASETYDPFANNNNNNNDNTNMINSDTIINDNNNITIDSSSQSHQETQTPSMMYDSVSAKYHRDRIGKHQVDKVHQGSQGAFVCSLDFLDFLGLKMI